MCARTSHSALQRELAAADGHWKKKTGVLGRWLLVGWPWPCVWSQTHEHMASMNWTWRILEKNRNKIVKLGEPGDWEVRTGAVRGE